MSENKKLKVKTRPSLTSLIITFLWLLILLPTSIAAGEYQNLPMSKKLDISQPNTKTELLVRISQEDNYSFRLIFKYKNPEERKQVSKLMRGKDADGRQTNGERTPVSIDVYAMKNGQNVLISMGGGEAFPTNASGLGYSKLVYNDYLMSGDYRVVVESKEGNSKFKNIEVEVYIGKAHRPK